jgi:chromosome segregation DNA-binding protein
VGRFSDSAAPFGTVRHQGLDQGLRTAWPHWDCVLISRGDAAHHRSAWV